MALRFDSGEAVARGGEPLHRRSFHSLTEGEHPVQRTRRRLVDRNIIVERGVINVLRWPLIGALPLSIPAESVGWGRSAVCKAPCKSLILGDGFASLKLHNLLN